MQDRYAGDIGDFVKFALLRALVPGKRLGIAWYLYPDEGHNSDGKHVAYLDDPGRWRHLDPELFDALNEVVRTERSVRRIEEAGIVDAIHYSAPIMTSTIPIRSRCEERTRWFEDALIRLNDCDLVFADPDNGLVDDAPHRRRQPVFGKQMPINEAQRLASSRCAVIYHHNTRRPGGHDREVEFWLQQLRPALAVRANAFSCRTFFILNPTEEVRIRAEAFCRRWHGHRVRLHELNDSTDDTRTAN